MRESFDEKGGDLERFLVLGRLYPLASLAISLLLLLPFYWGKLEEAYGEVKFLLEDVF